jgi:hypothetical protein
LNAFNAIKPALEEANRKDQALYEALRDDLHRNRAWEPSAAWWANACNHLRGRPTSGPDWN